MKLIVGEMLFFGAVSVESSGSCLDRPFLGLDSGTLRPDLIYLEYSFFGSKLYLVDF